MGTESTRVGQVQGISPGHGAFPCKDQTLMLTLSAKDPPRTSTKKSLYFLSSFSLVPELAWCKEDERLLESETTCLKVAGLPMKQTPPKYLPQAMQFCTVPMPCL